MMFFDILRWLCSARSFWDILWEAFDNNNNNNNNNPMYIGCRDGLRVRIDGRGGLTPSSPVHPIVTPKPS